MMPGDDQARNERDFAIMRRPLKKLGIAVDVVDDVGFFNYRFYCRATNPDPDDATAFYNAWTLQEAIVYARGLIDAALVT